MNVLTGIVQYLIDRNVEVRLYNEYIEITRNTSKIHVLISEYIVKCSVFRLNTNNRGRRTAELHWDKHNSEQFDLTDPNSLQAIYEFVIAKVNK